MPDRYAAQEVTVRYPNARAWQWDGSPECIQALLDAGAPISPENHTPDRGWQLECTARGEFHGELLWTGLWIIYNELGWNICEPNVYARAYIAR